MLLLNCVGTLDELKQFDTYMVALNSWCAEQQQSGHPQVPVYGQSVCVRHKDTSQWRRAQVTRLSDKYEKALLVLLYIGYYRVLQ